jgi:hypothetical protein
MHENERAGVVADPIAISSVPGKPEEYCTIAQQLQQRRLARVFFLPAQVAATVAELAYGGAA